MISVHLPAQTIKYFDFKSRPYLQNMNVEGVSVLWVTNNPCTSYVLYGETNKLGKKVFASHNGQIDANVPVQKIRLSNLEAGKTYYYKVVSKEIKTYLAHEVIYGDSVESEIQSFKLPTVDKTKFNFLAFNDLHDRPAFIDTVCKKNSGFDFIAYNGDILGDVHSEDQIINNLCNISSKAFASETPFVYTRGNHETRGSESRILGQYLESPNGLYYYSFTWGNTCFLVLDTGEDKEDNNKSYAGLADYDNYRTEQANWIKLITKSKEWKNAKHRIVCGHIPASLEGDNWHGTNEVKNKFLPILNSSKVDLYICGHTHVAKIEKPCKAHNFTLVIGGGPVYDVRQPGTTFIKVNVDGGKLNVLLYKKDGTLISEYACKK